MRDEYRNFVSTMTDFRIPAMESALEQNTQNRRRESLTEEQPHDR